MSAEIRTSPPGGLVTQATQTLLRLAPQHKLINVLDDKGAGYWNCVYPLAAVVEHLQRLNAVLPQDCETLAAGQFASTRGSGQGQQTS